MVERHSQADEPQLVKDPDEIARIESENALRQFDAAMEELEIWLKSERYKLRPSLILKLHRILLERLSEYAGVYRPAKVTIQGSGHKPPSAGSVPALVEELCEYVNDHWNDRSAVHLAAYILWRMNWIHPFSDGNGRTARIVSYLVLCAHSRNRLPGELTIPEQISRNKQPYYEALEAADKGDAKGRVDVSELEGLLGAHLANQLLDFYQEASGRGQIELDDASRAELAKVLEEAKAEGAVERKAVYSFPNKESRPTIIGWIERHPALTGLIGALLAAILGIIFAR